MYALHYFRKENNYRGANNFLLYYSGYQTLYVYNCNVFLMIYQNKYVKIKIVLLSVQLVKYSLL